MLFKMIPLFDKKQFTKIPYTTVLLILFNIVFFFSFKDNLNEIIYSYGFIPGDFNFTHILTSMFLHVNFAHLMVNMWFLWIFGDNVEKKIGHTKFLFFYLLCGILSTLIYFFFAGENLNVPLVGASGAISGVLGSYIILFPKNKLRVFPNFVFCSFWYIFTWFCIQLLFMYLGGGNVAYLGHVGGFISGLLLIFFFK
ncbi:MAG: rhomboid family intramembrane serine protease [Candidatus Pacebacteria bacterium]|nr:rhomboid family intramembrane serine protease [Candidatus Paceibacterota bacterium]